MYDLLKQKIEGVPSNEEKVNRLREFLQILILKIMFDREYFDHLAMVGGTALRILYDLRRYSEDIDFSLIKKQQYSFKKLLADLTYELKHYNLKVTTSRKESTVVHNSMIKFPDLLFDLGLSGIKSQKLSIKLEIDTNPPPGWRTVLSPVSETFVFALNHLDLPSMFATKIHACFFRRFTKGRDFYDLVWYLGKKVQPNYVLLNHAVRQTEKSDLNLLPENLKDFMKKRIMRINFAAVRKDVERFLEDKKELKIFERDVMMQLIDNTSAI